MSRWPLLAGILSLLVPGLGQIYAGQGGRGANILFATIVIGNLNTIWLSLYGLSSPGPNAL
jgi:TM2 domain-containing membrane protein YozV